VAAITVFAAILLFATCGTSGGESDDDDSVTGATTSQSPSPSPTASPALAQSYTVVEGDTLFDIAAQFGVTVEEMVAFNGLADAESIFVGQVLFIPAEGAVIPSVTPEPTPTAPDPRLRGFLYPIAGACLPTADRLMPNAPREYRSGIHEGVDFYTGFGCVDVPAGAPVTAAKEGTVIRADKDFVEMTADELNEILARTQAQGYTDEAALDRFRGRQVWIAHGDGIVTRYCHLSGIPEEIHQGSIVGRGELVGLVGDSGTPEAVTAPGVEIHLHWELRVDDSFLGAGLPADEVRAQYEALFVGN
jgi:murein DD-endopeptidase MepM/ murein hydrolase activator NlpD